MFPTALFAGLGVETVSDELAAELRAVLDTSANGDGLTATVISQQGTWNGATGMATTERAMVPNDQMGIASGRGHALAPAPPLASGAGTRPAPLA